LVNKCNRLISTVTPSYPDGVENKSKLIFIPQGVHWVPSQYYP